MNKRCYRLRFNHVRGQWMVVADIVVGRGKTHVGRACRAGGQPGKAGNKNWLGMALPPGQGFPVDCLRPIGQALLLAGAVGLVTLLPVIPANAQIVANKAMPAHTQPSVVTTANGVPQVNIQTPNGAGVSMNNYSQFDVQKNGAILNNSITSTQTQLAGWIQGNPLLHNESARVIVNQIQSADPSRLNGYIEVAGQRAQVVVANPAGITCDGCGFIQADRAVLTTGQVNLNPSTGALDNYVVRSGSVNIANMDASQTPYVDVLARAVKVTGALRAKQLDIKTGVNTIAADTGAVKVDATATEAAKPEGSGTQGDKPQVAIDVAELGGMYAGQITLLATEHGVGVNNAGHIQAGGGLTLSSDGQVHNRGTLAADGALQVQSDSLHNDGTLYGRTETIANTVGALQNNSQILSGGNIALGANGAQGRLAMARGSQLAAGLEVPDSADGQHVPSGRTEDRRLKPGQSITLQATQQATLSGTIQVDGFLLAQADKLSVADSQVAAEHIHAGAIDNEHTFNGDRAAQQQKGIQANTVSLAGSALNNRTGFVAATLALDFKLSEKIDNQNGFATSLGATRIGNPSGALVLNNEQGYISAKTGLLVQGAQLAGQQGTFAADRLTLDLKGDYRNTHSLIGQSQLDLSTTGDVRNDAKLTSGGTLTLNARHIQNGQAGQIQGRQARVNASGTLENQGLINGQDTLVTADQIRNLGSGRIYGQRLGLQARDILNGAAPDGLNQAGTIAAHDRLDIGAQTLFNQDGALIYSGGDAAFGRSLDADSHATGTAFSIVNNGSIIDIAGSATVHAEKLNNVNADYRTQLQQVGPIQKVVEFEPIAVSIESLYIVI